MTKGTMTREQAIAECGSGIVEMLDKENCDFTNRLQTDGDDRVEFSASIRLPKDHEYYSLIAYYYQESEDLQGVNDLSDLDWKVAGYELA